MKMEFTFGEGRPTEPPSSETPFRILVLGDLDGRTSRNVTQPLADRRPVRVDVDNFEAFLKRLRAEVQLGVTGASLVPPRLAVSELDDLHPDRLFERMETFAALRKTRAQLLNPATAAAAAEVRASSGGTTLTAPTVATEIKPSPMVKSRESDAGTLERLLGRAPAPAPETSGGAVELIQKIVAPYIVAAPAADQPVLVAAVDAAATERMRAVLHDPAFQDLESTWRGIDFLIHRLETSETLQVFILNLSRAELAAELVAAEDVQTSPLYKILVESTVQSPGADPWGLVLGLYQFEPTREDVEQMSRMAKLAQAAGAPFVTAAGAKLIQTVVQNPAQLDSLAEWMALRTSPAAGALGLAGPRFLLRLPYGKSTDPITTFDFAEFSNPPKAETYLWGNPALAIGTLLGQMFTESGWEMNPGDGSQLDGLPVHSWKEGVESRMTPCAELWLKDAQAERWLEHGLMPFQSIQGRDAIRLARVQSLQKPPAALSGRWG